MALFEFRDRSETFGYADKSSDFWYSVINPNNMTGTAVNRVTAMRLAIVNSCVSAISEDKAQLPIQVKQTKGDSTITIDDHPLVSLLNLRPNREQNAFKLEQTETTHVLLEGNSYLLPERNTIDQIKNIWLLDPESVKIERLMTPQSYGRGKLIYKVKDGISNKEKVYRQDQIIHVQGKSWSGLKGESVITNYAVDQIGLGIEMGRFQNNFFKNGLNPGGILEHPGTMSEKVKPGFIEALKKRFRDNRDSKSPLLLEEGMTYKAYDVKMADQQFLELLKANSVDICGIFGVPQSRVGISESNTNYNNTEQEKKRYAQAGLLPWIVQREQEMDWKLLTAEERKKGLFIQYDLTEFLRGDARERAEINEKYWRMGVPINNLLKKENLNPVEGGDVGRVQINTASIVDIDNLLMKKYGESNNEIGKQLED